jgi:hypothetical protein
MAYPVSRCEESSIALPVGNTIIVTIVGAVYVGYDHTERTDACQVRSESGPEN